jgi:hypothetical protein
MAVLTGENQRFDDLPVLRNCASITRIRLAWKPQVYLTLCTAACISW